MARLHGIQGELTTSVPAELRGMWRREDLSRPDVASDTTTQVVWLQTDSAYADLRVPADRPSHAQADGFDAFDDGELVGLAAAEGFAGVLEAANGVCLWRREIDLQPPACTPDEARYVVRGDRLYEVGLHTAYTETWARAADRAEPLAAFRAASQDGGLLVICGDHFLEVEGRRRPLVNASSLAEVVDHHLRRGRRDLATECLSLPIRHGRVAGGERPWQVTLSNLPWLEGHSLFSGEVANFDPDTAMITRSRAGKSVEWRLVTGAVFTPELTALLSTSSA